LGEDRKALMQERRMDRTAPVLPSVFLSHGAPTLAIDPSPARDFLAAYGADLDRRFGRPKAILVVSAHWETRLPATSTAAKPETIYDFRGFPDELYRMRYEAPGAPDVAEHARQLLEAAGITATTDPARGLDHGAWVPLSLLYPEADVPVTQLSVQPAQDPRHHFRVGEALRPLREDGALFLGSGSITHNLRDLFTRRGERLPYVAPFVDWLADRLAERDTDALLDYRSRAPHAIENHPTDEHLLPLFTALGAGSKDTKPRRVHRSETFGSLRMDTFEFS
jgi:4,5-DOPA dioxygenase extradiol